MHSYPWYIDNWRASNAVAAMTAEERGIYRELLDQCWRDGSLPNSERALQVFARVSDKEWKRSRAKVLAMFREESGRLLNATVEENRERVVASKGVSRENGKKGGRPAKPKENPAGSPQVTQSEPGPNHSLFGIRYSLKHTASAREESRNPEVPESFDGQVVARDLTAKLLGLYDAAGLAAGDPERARYECEQVIGHSTDPVKTAAALVPSLERWIAWWLSERAAGRSGFVSHLQKWLKSGEWARTPKVGQPVATPPHKMTIAERIEASRHVTLPGRTSL